MDTVVDHLKMSDSAIVVWTHVSIRKHLVGFGFALQLGKQTDGLHMTNLHHIIFKLVGCMFLYFPLIGLFADGYLTTCFVTCLFAAVS